MFLKFWINPRNHFYKKDWWRKRAFLFKEQKICFDKITYLGGFHSWKGCIYSEKPLQTTEWRKKCPFLKLIQEISLKTTGQGERFSFLKGWIDK